MAALPRSRDMESGECDARSTASGQARPDGERAGRLRGVARRVKFHDARREIRQPRNFWHRSASANLLSRLAGGAAGDDECMRVPLSRGQGVRSPSPEFAGASCASSQR